MKFAVIGTNFVSDYFADAVGRLSFAEISAVYSRKEETGSAFADKYGIKSVFTSYEEMLSSHAFDAVYVASPTLLHCEHSVKALECGYHVLCEKMMAASLEEFYLMHSAYKRSGRVLLEAMRQTFDPAYERVREALSKIGKIKSARLIFCQYSSRYDRFKNGILTNAFDPKMKNSSLSDIGIYPLNIAIDLFGKPREIKSESIFLRGGFEGEGRALLSCDGFCAEIIYSKIRDDFTPSEIVGEDGKIVIDKLTQPKKITLVKKDGTEEILDFPITDNNMIYEIKAFFEMTNGSLSCKPYLDLTEKTQIAVDKIYKQNRIDFHF